MDGKGMIASLTRYINHFFQFFAITRFFLLHMPFTTYNSASAWKHWFITILNASVMGT